MADLALGRYDCGMSVFSRLLAPAAFLPVLLPVVAINLVVQCAHQAGWVSYDSQKAAYIVSGAYLIAIAIEAISILRGR
jgi:hypothetical protein